MGNSHSQQHQFSNQQWTHSYPRTRHLQPQVKVLPERLPPLRLRTTDNGAILQNGGTLTARKQEERTYRPRSSSAHRPPKLGEINLDKTRFGSEPDLRYHLKESRDQERENAIRQRISRSRKKYKAPPAPQNGISSGMESSSSDLNGWESNCKDCVTSGQGRKTRLFKTRAETSRKNLTNSKKLENRDLELSKSSEQLSMSRSRYREERLQKQGGTDSDLFDRSERLEKKVLKRSASHEVISTKNSLATPEFQAELLEAAQRLRPLSSAHRENSFERKTNVLKSPKGYPKKSDVMGPRSLLENASDADCKQNKKAYQQNYGSGENATDHLQGENVAEEKTGKNQNNQVEQEKNKPERDVPSKKFYFGMEGINSDIKSVNNYMSTNNVDKTNAEHRITAVAKSKNLMNLYKPVAENGQDWEDTVDKFASNFHQSAGAMPNGNTTSCSSSFISDPDEDVDGGIALQLRPTLPKKQLEIPRFSPTAAWRLLSTIDAACPQASSPGGSDEIPVLSEEGIHAPLSQQILRSGHDKSGDSGISGDASPGGCPESSSEIAVTPGKTLAAQNSKNILVAWTPQQDLEEESSSDDLECPISSSKNAMPVIPGAKFSPRSQLFLSTDHSFSMSLPREERRMSRYRDNEEPQKERSSIDPSQRLNSLQKIKVALGQTAKRNETEENSHFHGDNWVLSRSVPSSLNNHAAIVRSVSNPSSPEQDEEYSQHASPKYPSYSYLGHGGRMMYLPEYQSRMSPDDSKQSNTTRNGFLSKSCENVAQTEMRELGKSRSPSPVNDRNNDDDYDDRGPKDSGHRPNLRKKKFTFQSTVRLLENRRLAEKLSREAELRENQRLSEVEAMKKVEEEFQKKRAREKASIRHQLRLFSLEEKNYSSLPPVEWDEARMNSDEAPASLPVPAGPGGIQVREPRQYSPSNRKTSVSSECNKFASTTQVLSEYREPIREYRDYRHSRCHETQGSSPDLHNRRSIVEHPKVVYDMPKNTAVYVSAPANSAQYHFKEEPKGGGVSTPRSSSSDNYRKDFAHGALAPSGRSLNSSDSELSQSHLRPASCQRITSRRLNALHRSRSASPECASRSPTPPKAFGEGFATPPRSRSGSPPLWTNERKSRCLSPERFGSRENLTPDHHLRFDRFQNVAYKSLSSLERKSSAPGDYHGTFNSHKCTATERNMEKPVSSPPHPFPLSNKIFSAEVGLMQRYRGVAILQKVAAKNDDDFLLRLRVPSLKPFNKTEKSYRPINFNPIINKLAQTVN